MTWTMHALRCSGLDGKQFYNYFGAPWYARAFGAEPLVVVELTENQNGSYYGWVPSGQDMLEMVAPHYHLFAIQFPYGPAEEELRNKGRTVLLSVREIEEAPDQHPTY